MLAKRLRADRGTEHGAAAVEFALIMVLFLTLIFAMLQYSMYFWSAQTGSSVTRAALRKVSVGQCQNLVTELKPYVKDQIGGATSDKNQVNVVRTYYQADGTTVVAAPGVVGGVVKLAVTFPSYDFNFPFLPFLNNATVQRVDSARVENLTSTGACS